jgi:hypothetical protein
MTDDDGEDDPMRTSQHGARSGGGGGGGVGDGAQVLATGVASTKPYSSMSRQQSMMSMSRQQSMTSGGGAGLALNSPPR